MQLHAATAEHAGHVQVNPSAAGIIGTLKAQILTTIYHSCTAQLKHSGGLTVEAGNVSLSAEDV